MPKLVKLSGLVICGVLLGAPAAFAQQAASPMAPASADPGSAVPATTAGAGGDVAAARANTPGAPVVNPPDPKNAGTLAESARTTALATYPWSTADTWFGAR